MINKIDAVSNRQAIQKEVQPPAQMQNKPAHSTIAATQIFPAQSIMEMAQSEMELNAQGFPSNGVSNEALNETVENMSFAIGSREGRSPGTGRGERPRARSMLQQLIKQVGATSEEQLEELHRRVPGIEDSTDPGDMMQQSGMNAGEMALLLAALLSDETITGIRRRRLEEALTVVMGDDEWALQLFNRLEFGAGGRNDLAQLRQLYQRATTRRTRLMQWFAEFRQLADRQRKLKTLIRALAFELSAEGDVVDVQLAAVITDLKRILQFLGMEDHCNRVAHALQIADMDGEKIMEELLAIAQQSWVSSDWLAVRTSSMVQDEQLQYRYARRVAELIKLLSNDCFEDDEQRETILTAFSEHLEKLADQDV